MKRLADILFKDDKTGEWSDTTIRTWVSYLFAFVVIVVLLLFTAFKVTVPQVVIDFISQILTVLLGSTQVAYSFKRYMEQRNEKISPLGPPVNGGETVGSATLTNRDEYLVEGIQYNSQRDNKINPSVACNVTSTQMFLQSVWNADKCPTDDDLMRHCNSKQMVDWANKNVGKWVLDFAKSGKLNQVHAVLAKAVNDLVGYSVCYSTSNLHIEKIQNEIRKGFPVVLGGLFVKLRNGKLGGHMVCCVGYNDKGLIINDPWGDWNTNYEDHNGEKRVYSYEKLKGVLSGNGIARL